MKLPFSKQLAVLGVCGAISLGTHTVQADDYVSPRGHLSHNVRIARPSENSAVNSKTTDTKAPRNVSTGGTTGTETRAVTGTNIPTTYRRFGHSTDTVQPVYVIDRDDPRFYSRGTVAGALRNLPFTSVGGR